MSNTAHCIGNRSEEVYYRRRESYIATYLLLDGGRYSGQPWFGNSGDIKMWKNAMDMADTIIERQPPADRTKPRSNARRAAGSQVQPLITYLVVVTAMAEIKAGSYEEAGKVRIDPSKLQFLQQQAYAICRCRTCGVAVSFGTRQYVFCQDHCYHDSVGSGNGDSVCRQCSLVC